MKRSMVVELGLVSSVAALFTSCHEQAPPQRVCVDANQTVLQDQYCANPDPRYHWYYARGYHSIYNGMRVFHGSSVPPSGGYVSRSGGSKMGHATTVRGGIGAAGEGASAGGHAAGGGGE